jgi:O-antigen ligase
MLLLRKQILAFGLILIVVGFFVLVANLFSGWVNHNAPLAVARPLQWVMFTKSKEAFGSIENSSLWRRELFQRAITEWQSDPRIFWFGRATYGFGVSDFVAQRIYGGFEAMQTTSLRRGTTHNLVTDLLVTYGLVGCILYYGMILAIIGFLWKVYRSREVPAATKSLVLVCLVSTTVFLAIASVGGGYYSVESIWLLIVLIAMLYQHRPPKADEERVILSQPLQNSEAQLSH